MSSSIFETRRAKIRFKDAAYEPLQRKLRNVLVTECEKWLTNLEDHLCLRWNITETVLHDEDRECVPDDYPVLIVEVETVFKDKLWLVKRCPFVVVVDSVTMYLTDLHQCDFGCPSSRVLAQIIASSLK